MMSRILFRRFQWIAALIQRASMAAVAIAVVAFLHVSRTRAEELERALLQRAPQIVKALDERGYKNVGVLKFRVKKGNEPMGHDVGTLNSFLAKRLEIALILSNRHTQGEPLGVIHDADSVAATIPRASHISADGRARLFRHQYELAWGNAGEKVTPDAFVTGVVMVSPDLKDLQVGILAFDRQTNRLERIIPVFSAAVDLDTLAEVGESFSLRGAFDNGQIQLAKQDATQESRDDALAVKLESQPHPLQRTDKSVNLEVFYDGQKIPVEFKNGQAFLAEPRKGQQIHFVLSRTRAASGRLAVVLKVNGENTLYRQRKRDRDCSKWILNVDSPPIPIRGYQKDDGIAESFRILSTEESRQREFDYGKDVGMITLTVFPEQGQQDALPADLPDEAAEDLLAMFSGEVSAEKPTSLAVLQRKLRFSGRSQPKTRGLIGEGADRQQKIRVVTFEAAPVPVFSAAIRYYAPESQR